MAQEKVEFPITGKIVKVEATQGSAIKEGDVLCVLESMKMENPILAPVSGMVIEISINQGDVVEAGDTVAVIEY